MLISLLRGGMGSEKPMWTGSAMTKDRASLVEREVLQLLLLKSTDSLLESTN
jgi:hypothetical protein